MTDTDQQEDRDPIETASELGDDVSQRLEEEIARADGEENLEDTVETLEELVEMDDDDTTTKNPPTHPNIIHNKGEPEKGNAHKVNISTEEIPTANLGANQQFQKET